ncbi:GntR family transcriptional regulator [Corallococcus coralloides DSM 2259]|uniref:GntR family transcriptional regulator n=1 Tax=Corallococcus coralloides (strain ATCC 25202 / DSM 2259 / NBRC 100086 / M2) TaxID=1144275 RepID=H8MN87_CORCM|nr:GntR family transcriptional regulator [Corallococcus coralloides]AFE05324.1 GntR family transcriptional regulator [Corallococcus coralloides DSM 2259]
MGMGRGGLVAYVEAQIERDIALGRLHPSGQFGSEAKLARRYEVCRGTIREALRRLAARGLVVQRPGHRTRAVALDESLTLENLGLALHDARKPDARWLLEGYFSLRRQVLVELLVDCCARASDLDLDRLGSTCFGLWNAARWEPGATCAQVEFELLRQAARVAGRPGHVLLVQSLQRAFLGGAAQLLPLLGGEALRQWVCCVMEALPQRNVQALQHELPALLKACDERVLNAFAPAPQEQASPETPTAHENLHGAPVPDSLLDAALETGTCTTDERSLGGLEPAVEDTEALGVAPRPHAQACPIESDNGTLLSSTVPGDAPCGQDGGGAGRDMADDASLDLSDCRANGGASLPPSGPLGAKCKAGGLFHGTLGSLGRWWARLLRLTADAFAGALLPRRVGQRTSG